MVLDYHILDCHNLMDVLIINNEKIVNHEKKRLLLVNISYYMFETILNDYFLSKKSHVVLLNWKHKSWPPNNKLPKNTSKMQI
jgi:hypothetical protein